MMGYFVSSRALAVVAIGFALAGWLWWEWACATGSLVVSAVGVLRGAQLGDR